MILVSVAKIGMIKEEEKEGKEEGGNVTNNNTNPPNPIELLFAEVAKQADYVISNCRAREIANICNSYAKLEISEHLEFFNSINGDAEIIGKIMDSGDIQAISNIATSFASLGVVNHENYFMALSEPHICKLIMSTVSIIIDI